MNSFCHSFFLKRCYHEVGSVFLFFFFERRRVFNGCVQNTKKKEIGQDKLHSKIDNLLNF